jgi:hypothetical protein
MGSAPPLVMDAKTVAGGAGIEGSRGRKKNTLIQPD